VGAQALVAAAIPPPNVLAACDTGNERHSYTRVLENLSLPSAATATGGVHPISHVRAETRRDRLYSTGNLARIREVAGFNQPDCRRFDQLHPEEMVRATSEILEAFEEWDAEEAREALRLALAKLPAQ
jgi:hypothetical protein